MRNKIVTLMVSAVILMTGHVSAMKTDKDSFDLEGKTRKVINPSFTNLNTSNKSISSLHTSDDFNPELAKFSRMETLETWIAPRYLVFPDLCKKIQRYVGKEVSENPTRLFPTFIPSFGRSFEALGGSQLPFLQHIKGISQSKETPIVMEIGTAEGRVAWKIPYALGGKGIVYVNELSSYALKKFGYMMKARLTPDLEEIIKIFACDCFEIPKDYSYPLWGKVDVLYVQNVEHFFNPNQHQRFLKLVSDLLSPDGRGYLTANTLSSDDIRLSDSCNTTGQIYPYFESIEQGDKNNFNYFTPDVYRNAAQECGGLEVIEVFLMNFKGERQSFINKDSKFVTAIVQKK